MKWWHRQGLVFTGEEISMALIALAGYRRIAGELDMAPHIRAAVDKVAAAVVETERGTLYLPPFEIR